MKETHFEVYQGGDLQYWWRLRASNGAIIATSGEGYTTRKAARKAAARVRAISAMTPIEHLDD